MLILLLLMLIFGFFLCFFLCLVCFFLCFFSCLFCTRCTQDGEEKVPDCVSKIVRKHHKTIKSIIVYNRLNIPKLDPGIGEPCTIELMKWVEKIQFLKG